MRNVQQRSLVAGGSRVFLGALAVFLTGCGPAIHGVVTLIGGGSGGIAATRSGSSSVDGPPSIEVNEDLVIAEGATGWGDQ